MFWSLYFVSITIVCTCLALYAYRKNVPCSGKNILGCIGLSILWPLFVIGTLVGYALIFMDELKL